MRFCSANQHKPFILTTAVVIWIISLVGSMAQTEGDRELQAGTDKMNSSSTEQAAMEAFRQHLAGTEGAQQLHAETMGAR